MVMGAMSLCLLQTCLGLKGELVTPEQSGGKGAGGGGGGGGGKGRRGTRGGGRGAGRGGGGDGSAAQQKQQVRCIVKTSPCTHGMRALLRSWATRL